MRIKKYRNATEPNPLIGGFGKSVIASDRNGTETVFGLVNSPDFRGSMH